MADEYNSTIISNNQSSNITQDEQIDSAEKEARIGKIFEDAIADSFSSSIESNNNSVTNPNNTKEIDSYDSISYYVETANAKILLDTLAPEVSKNEDKKREHKDKLIKYVSIFLGLQFIVIFVLIMLVLISVICFHALKNDFSFDMVKMLFAFFGTYITSVIVELVYILKYIVLNVFDTSISGLMEIFKSQKNPKEQDS